MIMGLGCVEKSSLPLQLSEWETCKVPVTDSCSICIAGCTSSVAKSGSDRLGWWFIMFLGVSATCWTRSETRGACRRELRFITYPSSWLSELKRIYNIWKMFKLRKPWYFGVILYKSYSPQILVGHSGLIWGIMFLLCDTIQ